MMKILSLTIFLLSFAILISAQEFTTPLHSETKPGAPIILYGSLTAATDAAANPQCPCDAYLTLVNVSGKPILLLAAELMVNIKTDDVIRERYDEIGINDYFLEPELFQPSASISYQDKITPYQKQGHRIPKSAQQATMESTVQVLFVQFADGSTWGDRQPMTASLQLRADAWNELLKLENVYRTQGKQQFLARLSEPAVRGPYLASLTSLGASEEHFDSLLAQMHTLLQRGESRLRDMGGSIIPGGN